MIKGIEPRLLMIWGLLLMLVGFALPMSMIMQMIPSTFFLNFLAYTASFLGLILGMIGIVTMVIRRRQDYSD